MIALERELAQDWQNLFYPPGPEMPEERPAPVEGAGGAAFGVFPAMRSAASRTGEISPAGKMLPADVAAGALKGTITGGVGTPGDIESLVRGIRGIFTRGGDQGKLDAFLAGLEEKTILPTSEDVSKWLDANVGPVVPPGAPMAEQRAGVAEVGQLAGELTSGPATLIKGAKVTGRAAARAGKALAPKAGEMLGDYMRRAGLTPELMAYHGTPHRFAPEEGAPLGRFRSEKIGTGEGAQAFGHGLYFAESPTTAGTYAISRGVPDVEYMAIKRGLDLSRDARIELMRQAKSDRSPSDAAKMLQNASRESRSLPVTKLAEIIDEYREASRGKLYTVDIPDSMVEKMLDWDKPFSEQPDIVRQVIKEVAASEGDPANLQRYFNSKNPNKGPTGQDFYNALASMLAKPEPKPSWTTVSADTDVRSWSGESAASKYLRVLGIPGIRYLDAGSREAGGTRNIVVFPGEEDKVKILKVE